MKKSTIVILSIIAWLLTAGRGLARDQETNPRIEEQVEASIDIRQATQKEEEAWRAEKEKLTDRYEQLIQEQAQLLDQKETLHLQAEATRGRVNAKEKQLADIQEISDQIQPFLRDLLEEVQTHVSNGPPFLASERAQRTERLKTLMADPEVSFSERYRKLMEALLIEAEYGFTIEAYQQTIEVEGQDMLADIFRLGRISLFFQSLDRRRCGFYNVAERCWQVLPPSHNPALQKAIDIAAKRRPVELLTLPLGRMVIP